MTGHGRKPNGAGYVRPTRRASGEVRYEARLRNKYLGVFETRKLAEDAIEAEQSTERALAGEQQ